jgi:hypothetical protein
MLLWELSILIDEVKQYAIDLLQKLLNTNFFVNCNNKLNT